MQCTERATNFSDVKHHIFNMLVTWQVWTDNKTHTKKKLNQYTIFPLSLEADKPNWLLWQSKNWSINSMKFRCAIVHIYYCHILVGNWFATETENVINNLYPAEFLIAIQLPCERMSAVLFSFQLSCEIYLFLLLWIEYRSSRILFTA